MPRILVLGGSYLQSFFIQHAIHSNYDVHVLDMDPNCYVNNWSNISFRPINIIDFKAVESYFLKKKCDIIIGPVTELGNRTAGLIAQKHGLLYNSWDSILATTDKSVMRELLKNAELNEPKVTTYKKNLNDILSIISFPFIIKPKSSSASRGVTLVRNIEEYHKAIKDVLPYIETFDDIVIEEYIEGTQYSIETISSNSKHFIVGITEEVLSDAPYFMERMDFISTKDHNKLYGLVQNFVNELLDTLKIKVGPCHIEVKIKKDNIQLIEVASRSGLIRDMLIFHANNNNNYNQLIIDSYLGNSINEIDIQPPTNQAYLGIVAYPNDFVTYLNLKENNLLVDEYFNGKGLSLDPKFLTDSVGYFFAKSNDIELLKKFFLTK